MICPDELTLTIFADGEAASGEVEELAAHLEGCAACRALVGALETENRGLRAALAEEPMPAPAGARAAIGGLFMRAAALVASVAMLRAGGVWTSGGGAGVLPEWLNPLSFSGFLNLLYNGLVLLVQAGGSVMEHAESIVGATAFAALAMLTAVWALGRRPRRAMRRVGLALALAAALASTPAAAIEMRNGQTVEVAAGEIIDGTLIAAGETVRVDADVDGDVIALARDVIVRGRVSGNVYVLGQNFDLGGSVGGSAHGWMQWVRFGGSIGGSALMGGQGVTVLPGARIERDAMFFGETLTVEGEIGRDVAAVGRRVEVLGGVGGDLEAWVEAVRLGPSARVGGDLSAHLAEKKQLDVDPAAFVGGETSVSVSEPKEGPSRYARPGYYLWRVVGLAGAFLVALVLLWLAPGLFGSAVEGAKGWLGRLGIGFLVLVATPVAAVLVAITLVGLPLALLALVAYLASFYLAKILVAEVIGRRLVSGAGDDRKRTLLALLAGLSVVTVATSLPWVGGWLGFLVILLGLGILIGRMTPGPSPRAAR